jgi:hypothetical protein
MANSIWGSALDAARDIFGGLIGDLLGWAIIIAVLAPFVAIVYFVLKKTGWRGLYPDPYRRKYSFSMTLGGQNPSEQVMEKLLSDPTAHADVVKLDASDPQARAKLETALRALEALGSVDPKIRATMEQAIQSLEANAPAQAGQPSPATKSEIVFVTGSTGAPENFPGTAPAILDSSAGAPLGGAPASQTGVGLHSPSPDSPPVLDPSVSNPLGGTPDWQKELQAKWKKERDDLAHEEHVAFVSTLKQNRSNLRNSAQAFFQPLRYLVAGLGAVAVVACFAKARTDSQYNLLGIAAIVATVWAWSALNPSQFD